MKNFITLVIFVSTCIISCNNKYDTFKDSRDGHVYKTIKIKKQIWMAENLAYKANGGCWAYENDQSNVAKYGYLYDWETATKVCPDGYHLPTNDEWKELDKNLRIIQAKENESGFNALRGGFRGTSGGFVCIGYEGNWWSATSLTSSIVSYRKLVRKNNTGLLRLGSSMGGLSVRCCKD